MDRYDLEDLILDHKIAIAAAIIILIAAFFLFTSPTGVPVIGSEPKQETPELTITCARGTYNADKDKCIYVAETIIQCDQGIYNSVTEQCELNPNTNIICTSGTYNPATGNCEIIPDTTVECEYGAFDETRERCVMQADAGNICDIGTFDTELRKCVYTGDVEIQCSKGTLDEATGKCIIQGSVETKCSKGTYNSQTGKCDYLPSVMVTCTPGNYDVQLDKCVLSPQKTYVCSDGALMYHSNGTAYCNISIQPPLTPITPINCRGDVNMDSVINDSDLILLQSYLTQGTAINTTCADYNQDSLVSNTDYLCIDSLLTNDVATYDLLNCNGTHAFNYSNWTPAGWTFAHAIMPENNEISARMSPPVILSDGSIVTGSSMGIVYKFNTEGTILWSWKAPFSAGQLPWSWRYSGESGDGSHIYARWGNNFGAADINSLSLLSDESIIVPTSNNQLYALNSNGSLKWEYDLSTDSGLTNKDRYCFIAGGFGNVVIDDEDNIYIVAHKVNGIQNGVPQISESILFVIDKNGNEVWRSPPSSSRIKTIGVKSEAGAKKVYGVLHGNSISKISSSGFTAIFKEGMGLPSGYGCFAPNKMIILSNGDLFIGNNHQDCSCSADYASFWVIRDMPSGAAPVVWSENGIGCVEGNAVESEVYLYVPAMLEEFVTITSDPWTARCKSQPNAQSIDQSECGGKLYAFEISSHEKIGSGRLSYDLIFGGTDGNPVVDGSLVYISGNAGYVDIFYHDKIANTFDKVKSIKVTNLLSGDPSVESDEMDAPVVLSQDFIYAVTAGGNCAYWGPSSHRPCRIYSILKPGLFPDVYNFNLYDGQVGRNTYPSGSSTSQSCAPQGGHICTSSETCFGNILTASDSSICCSVTCSSTESGGGEGGEGGDGGGGGIQYNQPCTISNGETGKTCDSKAHCSGGEIVGNCCLSGGCSV